MGVQAAGAADRVRSLLFLGRGNGVRLADPTRQLVSLAGAKSVLNSAFSLDGLGLPACDPRITCWPSGALLPEQEPSGAFLPLPALAGSCSAVLAENPLIDALPGLPPVSFAHRLLISGSDTRSSEGCLTVTGGGGLLALASSQPSAISR